jgi:hypothetical protein
MRGFQLWVNLPAQLKLTAPAYQEHPAAKMPVEQRDGGVRVKVIAGATSRSTAGPVTAPSTDARYFDVELPAGANFEETIPAEHAALVVVYEGAIRFDDSKEVEALGLAQLGAGDAVRFSAKDKPARALVIAGKPLKEPVAWMGPFVMNTQQEPRRRSRTTRPAGSDRSRAALGRRARALRLPHFVQLPDRRDHVENTDRDRQPREPRRRPQEPDRDRDDGACNGVRRVDRCAVHPANRGPVRG